MNLNQIVHVRLTARGREILEQEYQALWARNPKLKDICKVPEPEADGLYRFHLWALFDTFGPGIGMGQRPVFENNEILTKQEDALRQIQAWRLPDSGCTWSDGGSNGERDYMRQLAREALEI